MEKRNTVLLTIIAVATLLVAIVGATFAYFSASITETDKTQTNIKAAQLGIVFDGTQEIEALSIEPGWSAQKKFTVENTSSYDMTYDINFTGVANNFVNTNDLTASGTAVYVQGSNGQTHSGDVKMVAIDATSVSGTQYDFALPNNNSYVLPVDNTADFTGSDPVVGTNVYKVARVFIPAGAKEEITITLAYAYKAPTSGYALGDPTDPNNQNADQGKIFKTTFAIVANGIDTGNGGQQGTNNQTHTGSNAKGEYPTNSNS